jgi:hypothetical protein
MEQATTVGGRRKFDMFSRLKIVNPHLVVRAGSGSIVRPGCPRIVIPQIKSLDLSLKAFAVPTQDSSLPDLDRQYLFFEAILDLPSLEHLDLSNWREGKTAWGALPFLNNRLNKLTWHRLVLSSDESLLQRCPGLSEVSMDGGRICVGDEEEEEKCIFLAIRNELKRVSIKGSRLGFRPAPIPQTVLIAFVRNAPKLNWFRSDLTPDNVAMLKGERPDITFVA